MSTQLFNVVLEGTTLRGEAVAAVAAQLAKLVKRDNDFAAMLLRGQPTKIKSGVDEATGARYVEALERIGVAVRLEPEFLDIDTDAGTPERVSRDGESHYEAATPSQTTTASSAPQSPPRSATANPYLSRRILETLRNATCMFDVPGFATFESCDIAICDKGIAFIAIDGYTTLGQAGGILLQGAIAAFNKVQEKRHSHPLDLSEIYEAIDQGKAIMAESPDIMVNPLQRDGLIEAVSLMFDPTGARITVSGDFYYGNEKRPGNTCFETGISLKNSAKWIQRHGFDVRTSSTTVPQIGALARQSVK